MNFWIDFAGVAEAALFAAVSTTRSILGRGETGPELHRLTRRIRLAFRRGHREEKVALLGLVLVLAFLSWP